MNIKINMLDDLTINKIAAGEVVESPYSAVKELIENAIDSGASTIVLEIKQGGKKYIRITDNGVGIKEEYVEKAFKRHSTSKITSINDLSNINSLGFRGEALASISAVSQIEMVTRTSNQQHGIQIKMAGGKIESKKMVGCPVGTTVIVKSLFFNTPARLKFMKSNGAETMKITEIITRLSLSNPTISFKYINNNNIMFTTPGNNSLSQAIISVFNKNTFKNLIHLDEKTSDMKLEGYIGQPSFVRGNRNLQIFYLNGRYIKNKLVNKAIEMAYKEKVIINKHPICILNLIIDPSEVDVNVHPSKTEVKFQNEDLIYEFIYNSITNILEKNTMISTITPVKSNVEQPKDIDNKIDINIDENLDSSKTIKSKIDNKGKSSFTESVNLKHLSVNETKQSYFSNLNTNLIKNDKRVDAINMSDNKATTNKFIDKIDRDVADHEEQLEINENEKEVSQSFFLNSLLYGYKIVGQIFNSYIVVEKNNSIYLIDQHAAHERLIYNKFLEEIKNESIISQRLVKPKVLELSNEDYMLLSNNINLFTKLGFQIEDFGTNTMIVREVPIILGKPRDFNFIYEILDEVRTNNNINNFFEDTIIKRACKAAIKAKDRLNHSEMKRLIEDLNKIKPPLTCPHGRPIILTMSKYEIEKYFKRIQ